MSKKKITYSTSSVTKNIMQTECDKKHFYKIKNIYIMHRCLTEEKYPGLLVISGGKKACTKTLSIGGTTILGVAGHQWH